MNRANLPFMKSTFVALLAASSVAIVASGAAQAVTAANLGKGEALYAGGDAVRGILACVICHGPAGNSSIVQNPKLAAQHQAYIVKQLANFKSAERTNPIMIQVAKALTSDEARNVAAYLNAQILKPSAAKNKVTIELGKKIYRAGIAEKNVPACAGCHGPSGSGIPAQFALIGGQHQEYTIAQLSNFNSGARSNNPAMITIAKHLSPDEIQAVANYVAGLK